VDPLRQGTNELVSLATQLHLTMLCYRQDNSSHLVCTLYEMLEASRIYLEWYDYPRCRRHEPSSSARTVWSWIRIPLEAWMSVLCAFTLCVGSGLATGWSTVQGVLPTVYRIKKPKNRPRSKKSTVEPQIDMNTRKFSIASTKSCGWTVLWVSLFLSTL
jgi:hypothetical protein